ncbi:MAG: sodium:proton antiporter [Coxiellaceae bacterium]|nr:sodium:proton antiporter [Coxiellaceae bacterium]
MSPYTLASIILTLAVAIGYINYRYIKMQSTIAIMVGSLLISLIFIFLQHTGIANVADQIKHLLIQTDFHSLLINGMLSFLLFAGSLTIDFSTLKTRQWEIGILASISTIASALLISAAIYYLLPLIGLSLPFLYCLLFGALISPTDPIAVLATFKQIGAPKSLEVCVAGESLFNDGVGIVIFLTIYELTFQHQVITFKNVSLLFLEQAIGGIAYGAILGFIAHHLIKNINDAKTVILITLALVTGGYTFALSLNISGPLAMVVAGIFLGNKVRSTPTESKRNEALKIFWEVIDELLNAVLFLLIGFELLNLNFDNLSISSILIAIPLVLLVRLVTVAIPMKSIQMRKTHEPYTISVLTWGGLRGGLAVALALTLPASHYRELILTMTYGVVVFAIIVQGLTIKPLAKLARGN